MGIELGLLGYINYRRNRQRSYWIFFFLFFSRHRFLAGTGVYRNSIIPVILGSVCFTVLMIFCSRFLCEILLGFSRCYGSLDSWVGFGCRRVSFVIG